MFIATLSNERKQCASRSRIEIDHVENHTENEGHVGITSSTYATRTSTRNRISSRIASVLIHLWAVCDSPTKSSTNHTSRDTDQIRLLPCISVRAFLVAVASQLAKSHSALPCTGNRGMKYNQPTPRKPAAARINATRLTRGLSDLANTMRPPIAQVSSGNNRSGKWISKRRYFKNPVTLSILFIPFFMFGLFLVDYLKAHNSPFFVPVGVVFICLALCLLVLVLRLGSVASFNQCFFASWITVTLIDIILWLFLGYFPLVFFAAILSECVSGHLGIMILGSLVFILYGVGWGVLIGIRHQENLAKKGAS